MSGGADLERQQRLFWELIAAPEGVAAGWAALGDAERELAHALVCERAGMSATERLDVYANMYFFRILDVLKEDFPALLALLGADAFHNLITDYLLAHPSRHWSLRWVGERLPEFLSRHELGRDAPHLADVATLEWALHDAFDAADAHPLTAQDLASVAPEAWPALQLALDPSVRLLRFETAAPRIWQEAKAGNALGDIGCGPVYARVWRREMRVFHKTIPAFEHGALAAVAAGLPFAEICGRLAGDATEPTDIAGELVGLIRTWLGDGLLAAQVPHGR